MAEGEISIAIASWAPLHAVPWILIAPYASAFTRTFPARLSLTDDACKRTEARAKLQKCTETGWCRTEYLSTRPFVPPGLGCSPTVHVADVSRL